MSIPAISNVGATGRTSASPTAPTDPALTAVAAAAVTATQTAADPTLPAVPTRFPWLSRLTQQLESASQQRSTFAPAPSLGDHLDRSA